MSLKKIAELTGTSISTVSRVLNHPEHTCQDPGLIERIWEAAAKLNYLPNPAARNLRLGISNPAPQFTTDIFLTRFDSLDQDLFFQELFQHIKNELLRHNCLLGEILNPADITNLSARVRMAGGVPYRSLSQLHAEKTAYSPALVPQKTNTGLIILGKCPVDVVPVLQKRYPYIVGIDRNPTEFEYDEIICDGTAAAQKAVEYLISLGHRDIAYIGDCTYESRYTGYYQTLLNHKIPLDYNNIFPSTQTIADGERIMHLILSSSHLPGAIFCANDCTAIGVLNVLKKNKKRGYFPSIISIDNIEESKKTKPLLSTIDIPKTEMAHLAVSLLIDRKNGGHTEHIRLELPCRLVQRESCLSHS